MDWLTLSSYSSLAVQFITGIVGIDGLLLKLKKEDIILQQALKLETFVQLVEFIFYIYLVYSLYVKKLPDNITSTRYIDWFITTPTMLISTIVYLKYQEYHETKQTNNQVNEENKENKVLDFIQLLKDEKVPIIKILIGNWLMLLFGYLGERNVLEPKVSVSIGFIFFAYTFKILYSNYGSKSQTGLKLYYFMFLFWSLYGVAAVFDFNNKNISYNILDLFAKNFYGLFLYFVIKSKAINTN